MYSCTTCRLNSMLCERCCLAMAFIFRKPRTPVKSLTSTCPAPGAHSTRRPAHVGFTPESGLRADIAPCPKSAPEADIASKRPPTKGQVRLVGRLAKPDSLKV